MSTKPSSRLGNTDRLAADEERHVLRSVGDGVLHPVVDHIIAEDPLEIRIAYGPAGQRKQLSLAVMMRTPGHDLDLVRGFLYSEGIIAKKQDLLQMRYIGSNAEEGMEEYVVLADLHPNVSVDIQSLGRNTITSSSCGVCGKAALDSIEVHCPFVLHAGKPEIPAAVLHQLPGLLRDAQHLFSRTGGVHAAGLFDVAGKLMYVREDVGRHNAVDKLIGAAMEGMVFPLQTTICMVSGRVGFELVQKAVVAGIPILAAVGAPTSLAVALAETHGITLVGFLRPQTFNVYSGPQRITFS